MTKLYAFNESMFPLDQIPINEQVIVITRSLTRNKRAHRSMATGANVLNEKRATIQSVVKMAPGKLNSIDNVKLKRRAQQTSPNIIKTK